MWILNLGFSALGNTFVQYKDQRLRLYDYCARILLTPDGWVNPEDYHVLFDNSGPTFLGMHSLKNHKVSHMAFRFKEDVILEQFESGTGTTNFLLESGVLFTDFTPVNRVYRRSGVNLTDEIQTRVEGDFLYLTIIYGKGDSGTSSVYYFDPFDPAYYRAGTRSWNVAQGGPEVAEALLTVSVPTSRRYRLSSVGKDYEVEKVQLTHVGLPDLFFRNIPVKSWGELAAQAYDTLPFFQGNGIAYAQEAKELVQAVDGTIDAIKALKHPTPKAVADIYLSFHYGWKLTAMDTVELGEKVKDLVRNGRRQSRLTARDLSVEANTSVTRFLHVYYEPFGQVMGVTDLLQYFDLTPTLDNIWDMLPYSFVIDWLVNIGDLASGVTNFFNATQVSKVLCTQRSELKMETVQIYEKRTFSKWTKSSYERVYMPDYYYFPEYHLDFHPSEIPNHILELGSLIVSNLG